MSSTKLKSNRAIVTYLAERWNKTLTENQRAAWNRSKTARLSGFNYYVKTNITRIKQGLSYHDNP